MMYIIHSILLYNLEIGWINIVNVRVFCKEKYEGVQKIGVRYFENEGKGGGNGALYQAKRVTRDSESRKIIGNTK